MRTNRSARYGTSSFGSLPDNWEALSFDRQSGAFHSNLRTPAGKPAATVEIPHVGVGEVFVVAVQSNATDYGEVRQETHSGMVAAFGAEAWRLANDPQTRRSGRQQEWQPFVWRCDLREIPRAVGGGCPWTWFHQRAPMASQRQPFRCAAHWQVRRQGGRPRMGVRWHSIRSHDEGDRPVRARRVSRAAVASGPIGFAPATAIDIPADVYWQLLERIIRDSRERAGWDFRGPSKLSHSK